MTYLRHMLEAARAECLWWVDPGWTPSAHQVALSLPSSAGLGAVGEEITWKKTLVGQDKGSLKIIIKM